MIKASGREQFFRPDVFYHDISLFEHQKVPLQLTTLQQ